MNIHLFIFSNKREIKIARHALFWIVWILYYSFMSALLMSRQHGFTISFFASFVEVAESTPLDMGFCYFIIYFLLPRFLYRGKYIGMLVLWLLASIGFIGLYELNAMFIVPYIRDWFELKTTMSSVDVHRLAWDFFTLFSQINMEGCVAASIKLGKLWYIKQQEIDLLKQEMEKVKPSEEKGWMHPAFLNDLLNRIEMLADTKPLIVANSIKEIRNLLTYMLYENAQAKVLLKKELKLLKEYVGLEKMLSDGRLAVHTHIDAEAASETIAPFILLPFIENAFRQVYAQPLASRWIAINIQLQQNLLQIHLKWNKPMDTSTLAAGRNVILQNISKRLQLIYPQSHELKIMLELEQVIVDLKMNLKKAIN